MHLGEKFVLEMLQNRVLGSLVPRLLIASTQPNQSQWRLSQLSVFAREKNKTNRSNVFWD